MDKKKKFKTTTGEKDSDKSDHQEKNSEEEDLEKNSEEEDLEKILIENSEVENSEEEFEETETDSKNLEESLNENGDISNNIQENQYTPNSPTYMAEENPTNNREVNYETSRTGNLYSGESSGSDAYSTTSGIQYSQNSEDQAYSGNIGNVENNPDRLKSFEEKNTLEKKSMSSFGKSKLIQEDNKEYMGSQAFG
tara:strand:+ start:119 stop:703 length:585 start_codon:yes stop_codon:yes gene_type:complete